MINYKLPKSAVTVLEVMSKFNGISPSEIVSRTQMNPRTVRFALKRLREKDLVEIRPLLSDMRSNHYRIRRDIQVDIYRAFLSHMTI